MLSGAVPTFPTQDSESATETLNSRESKVFIRAAEVRPQPPEPLCLQLSLQSLTVRL